MPDHTANARPQRCERLLSVWFLVDVMDNVSPAQFIHQGGTQRTNESDFNAIWTIHNFQYSASGRDTPLIS